MLRTIGLVLTLAVSCLSVVACEDSSPGRSDAGALADGSLTFDAGLEDASVAVDAPATDGPVCQTDLVNPSTARPCAATTYTCINGPPPCEGDACVSACLDGDPNNAMCLSCINQNLVSCANTMGCQDEWDAFTCCGDTRCPTGGSSCLAAMCGAERSTFLSCVSAVGEGCRGVGDTCFVRPSTIAAGGSRSAVFDEQLRSMLGDGLAELLR